VKVDPKKRCKGWPEPARRCQKKAKVGGLCGACYKRNLMNGTTRRFRPWEIGSKLSEMAKREREQQAARRKAAAEAKAEEDGNGD
jgi:hypothetical protein